MALSAAKVSANFLSMLGVTPALGRGFLDDESVPGRDRVALLDFDVWQNRFGADRAMVERTINLDGRPYTVIGVLPRGFSFWAVKQKPSRLLDSRRVVQRNAPRSVRAEPFPSGRAHHLECQLLAVDVNDQEVIGIIRRPWSRAHEVV